jgi:FMN phosphatase YigB (HAD superfamily)
MSQSAFISVYFTELGKVFARMGMDTAQAIQAVWTGTKAMIRNDGSCFNSERFWAAFSASLGLTAAQAQDVEAACDAFYTNEFDSVKSILTPQDTSKRLVRAMAAKGFTVVLATNPLFPLCGVETRLRWIGLELTDFAWVTHYANSTYCKPNLGYYREVLGKIGKEPERCLMAGNNPAEDMCIRDLGADTFLVTDCLENEAGTDTADYRRGTLLDLEHYLMSL